MTDTASYLFPVRIEFVQKILSIPEKLSLNFVLIAR